MKNKSMIDRRVLTTKEKPTRDWTAEAQLLALQGTDGLSDKTILHTGFIRLIDFV